jgi:SHS2 domain-containing protein
MKTHRIVPHPADVGFLASGATFDEMVDEAIAALAEIGSGGAPLVATERRPLPEIDGEPEDRLVRVLEHCLFLLDTDDWLAMALDGQDLRGAPLTPDDRAAGTHIKAVTWHQLAVTHETDGWRCTVFLDL